MKRSKGQAQKLANQVALITGGSAGIGLAVAKRLVREGARVALVARTASKLDEAVRELGASSAVAFPLDVNDRAALRRLPGAIVEKMGRLDILINNAGLNHRGPVLDFTPDKLCEIVETNLISVIYLTRCVLDVLKSGGAIVNVGSLAGKVPYADQATYCASKAGLRAFSMALREELAPRGISVMCMNPGPVDTGFFGDLRKAADLTFSQPMSSAKEVAEVILKCLQNDTAEADLPFASGKLVTLAYLFPRFKYALQPLFRRIGAANKARYLRSKGL